MKLKLYVAKNDGVLHLVIRKNKSNVLLCNPSIVPNKHRIAIDYQSIWIIAPTPPRKNICAKCVLANRKLRFNLREQSGLFEKSKKLTKFSNDTKFY